MESEALQALEKNFATAKIERAKAEKRIPRPGTRGLIEFAAQWRVQTHSDLAEHFISRVLNLDGAWISDESSLWDFHFEDTNEALIARIKEVYGVNVADIQSAKLSEIFERIATVQRLRDPLKELF